jgi:hypothetical protein
VVLAVRVASAEGVAPEVPAAKAEPLVGVREVLAAKVEALVAVREVLAAKAEALVGGREVLAAEGNDMGVCIDINGSTNCSTALRPKERAT